MQLELRQLQQRVGITFVFVTHDQEEALTMSDRVAVMARGKVLQIDVPTLLYETPVDREVADFIGDMNFFEGTVQGIVEGRAVIDAGPLGMVQSSRNTEFAQQGADITVAIRPERVTLTAERPNAEVNVVRGTMSVTTFLGDRRHFYVEVAGIEKPIVVSTQTVILVSGDERDVWLSWPEDAVTLLPPN